MVFIVRNMDEADLRGTLMLMTVGLEQFSWQGADELDLDVQPGLIPDKPNARSIGDYEIRLDGAA